MKNNFFFIILFFFIFNSLLAENVSIESKTITLDKNKEISIFENQVKIVTEENEIIESDFAEYNRLTGIIILKGDVKVIDKQNNIIESENAKYDEKNKIFKSIGKTKIKTFENYLLDGEDIVLDNDKFIIFSEKNAILTDQDQNKIFLENFNYQRNNSIFKSVGYIKIQDKLNNIYEFSQIYIDTKKKEILGTDIKSFLNDERFKIEKENKPRVFANTVKINKENTKFNKSIFTLCNYRKNDKCPPWTIQASEMLHDSTKKTIYYNNAVVKVYDIPIFYIPKLSHPDPSVDRRSGFLPPSFADSKNLGSGISIPFFWAIDNDKNFTFTNKLYVTENPLFLGEFHQVYQNSSLLADFGYTEGYKKSNSKKKAGDKNHFFSKFITNFKGDGNSDSTLKVSIQDVSNDKYLKLYKINSNLVDYNSDTLENEFNFTHEDENIFFGFNASMYETLKENYEDKYEYILPEITVDKNLISNDVIGNIDLQTNYKVHKYETNKLTNFLVNDLNWVYNKQKFPSGFESKILGNLKNINYETKNVDLYKKDTTSELHGAIGYLTEINLQKKEENFSHFLKPKLLIRYAPGEMRKESSGPRLEPISAFSLNRLNNINNFETGLTGTIGFDYKINHKDKELDFSVAQIISEKENKKMASNTSLDEKLSDVVGATEYKINEKISLNYNFSIDQNYSDFNYNEVSTILNFDPIKIDFDYLRENKHIGDQEYFKTKIDFAKSNNGLFSFEAKRNLITNSAEFYNLSYEYLNDCLKAGLVYRREFYTDSELEPENSLMFKITLTPFGNINSPSFSR